MTPDEARAHIQHELDLFFATPTADFADNDARREYRERVLNYRYAVIDAADPSAPGIFLDLYRALHSDGMDIHKFNDSMMLWADTKPNGEDRFGELVVKWLASFAQRQRTALQRAVFRRIDTDPEFWLPLLYLAEHFAYSFCAAWLARTQVRASESGRGLSALEASALEAAQAARERRRQYEIRQTTPPAARLKIGDISSGDIVPMLRRAKPENGLYIRVARDGSGAEVRAVPVTPGEPAPYLFAISSGTTRWINYQGIFIYHA